MKFGKIWEFNISPSFPPPISFSWCEWLRPMDVKLILAVLTGLFTVACLFFGTRNGFYDTDNYHGNGSAH